MLHTAGVNFESWLNVRTLTLLDAAPSNHNSHKKRLEIMQTPTNLNRRSFVQIATVGVVGLALAAPAFSATTAAPPKKATAAVLPKLELDNPTAKALGYVEDTTKVNATKYPNHKADQICSGCSLWQGDVKSARNPCTIFPGKSVANKGWCASFAKKA